MEKVDITPLDAIRFNSIGAVSDALNRLRQIHATPDLDLSDVTILFRGHADKAWSLTPGIYRGGYNVKEAYFLSDIQRYCPDDFRDVNQSFRKLVKVQHYELPTRLLDISESILTALYFSVCQEPSKTGSLIFFFIRNRDLLRSDNTDINPIARLSFIAPEVLNCGGNRDKFKNMLRILSLTGEPMPWMTNENDLDKVYCVLPYQDNPRIIRQQGAFFIFGIENGDKSKMSKLDVSKIEIPVTAKKKKEILEELKLAGISERVLFPEIDKVAHYLKTF